MRYRSCILCLSLAAALSGPAWPQEARGRLLGRVTDDSAAVIPQVEVKITNRDTGVTTTAVTNEQGNYAAPFLIPGFYNLAAEKTGFKRFVREGLELRVDDRLEVNITLQLGDVIETITVAAETPLLDTTSASMGQVVDSRRISDLPLPHGVAFQLIKLAPGTSFTQSHAQFDQPYAPSHMASYSMDGARSGRNELSLDGVPNTSTGGNNEVISAYVPPADVVAEFKVQTAAFDASVGQTEGGVVDVSLKSGTNALHGTAYYTKMDPVLQANSFFGNLAGQPKGDYDYNRWGVNGGGPVWFPKLYDGRNRTFFLHGYEAIRTVYPRGTTLTVPTAKQREGDLSDLLKIGPSYQIYDPYSWRPVTGGRFQSDPIAGNVIPPSRISPIARNILKYYPLPNQSGTADGRNNLALPNETEDLTYYTHMFRLDQNFSEKHRIFSRVTVYKRYSIYDDWFHNAATGSWFEFLSRGFAFDDVYSFSPTFVMNLRYGYNRFVRRYDAKVEAYAFDLTSLGFPASYSNAIDPAIRRFPDIRPGGYAGSYNSGILWNPTDIHSLTAAFDKVVQGHTIKFGAEYRAYRENRYQYPNSTTGRFDFGTTYTRGPVDNSPAAPIGQDLASLLLGIATGGGVDRNASLAEQSTVWAGYVQDDWKVTRRLNLTLGLRYEIEGPLTERYNRTVRGFDSDFVQPIDAQVRANYAKSPTPEVPPDQFRLRGGLLFAGVGNQPRTLWERDRNNFMPRIGLAYNLQRRTVLRAGYGMFYGFLGQRRGDAIQTGFSQNTPLIASLDGGVTYVATLANPYPTGILGPSGAALGALTYVGMGVSFFNPKPVAPYMQRWQFGIQHELPHRVAVEAAYVGNRGTKIETTRELNATPLAYLSTSPVRDQARIDYLSTNLPNPFGTLLPGTSRAGQYLSRGAFLIAYPHFTSLTTTTNEGYSWYHSLQLKMEKRFSHGYTFQAAYTWSKLMEATGFLNGADPRPERVISDQDYPHRLALSGIWELPLGRGRKFLSSLGPLADRIAGGWQVQGLFNGQSGQALGFGNVIFNGDLHNIVLPKDQRKVQRWFNVDAGFERDSRKQLGSNVRRFPTRFNGIRADGINLLDLSVIKYVAIKERFKLQFRGEFLNAPNHPMFQNPNTSVTSTAFGTITAERGYPRRIQLGLKLVY